MKKNKADAWMDGIAKDHGVIAESCIGVEIVCRLVLKSQHDHEYVEELLDKAREIGAAEITQHVKL